MEFEITQIVERRIRRTGTVTAPDEVTAREIFDTDDTIDVEEVVLVGEVAPDATTIKRVSRLAVVTIIRSLADQLEASMATGFGGEQHLRPDGSDVFPEVTVPDAFLRAFSGMEDDEEG